MCKLSVPKIMGTAGVIASLLGAFAHADDSNALFMQELTRDTYSPSRKELISLLISPNVSKNYIPIASHRAQVMGDNLPENSLSAIKNVNGLKKTEILELDIKITSDGVPYLMHDSYLQRTTNFVDTVVGDYADKEYGASSGKYTWKDIHKLYLKNVDGTYTNESPVTFEEVLIWVGDKTEMLINLDINEDAVFRSVWEMVKKHDAFEFCIFKGRYEKKVFKEKYYDSLSDKQKESLIYFPMIPDPTEALPEKSMSFYKDWEKGGEAISKGYEVGYKKDSPNASFPVEKKILEVVSEIRKDNRVRVHVFSAMPDNYLGRYIGNVNIDQCCNAGIDSRGDLDYLLDPLKQSNLENGANGYIITDDPVNLDRYLYLLGKRNLGT